VQVGEFIPCDQNAQVSPPVGDYWLEWLLTGDNDWINARGGGVACFCERAFGVPNEPTILKLDGSNSPATPPANAYTVKVNARGGSKFNLGGIKATASRQIHVVP
jgi:hypothetical protein